MHIYSDHARVKQTFDEATAMMMGSRGYSRIHINRYLPVFTLSRCHIILYAYFSDYETRADSGHRGVGNIIKLQKSLYITRWKVVRPHRTTCGAIDIFLSKSHTMPFFPRLYDHTL